jgi:Fe2+ or Zn2+ uptake regulation protein
MTTAEVIAAARRQVAHIDASTVYRTLAELRDAHMVAETRLAYGESFYEWIAEEPHHHLRCASCGSLTGLDSTLVSHLASGSLKHHGFKLNTDHLVFEGLCAQCRRRSSPRPPEAEETRQP